VASEGLCQWGQEDFQGVLPGLAFGVNIVNLQDILKKKRSGILKAWSELIVQTYPEQTARFLKTQKDQFQNPVGTAITEQTGNLFDHLVSGEEPGQEVNQFLDRIIRVRALQDFTPSQALAFIFQLKGVVRSQLSRELSRGGLEAELVAFESRVDRLALMAFEIYMACREKIYDLQAKEMRNLFAKALERTGIFCEIPAQEEPDLGSGE